MSREGSLLLAFVLLIATGCGPSGPAPPKTYQVRGKVLFQTDGKPLSAGLVEFQSTTDANLNGRGELNQEGEYIVQSIFGRTKLEGLAEGTYRVTVVPPQGPDQTGRPIPLEGTYEVKPDGPNEFTLTIPGKSQ